MNIGAIIAILYGVVVFTVVMMGIFIIYHIVKYSFSKSEMAITLGLFLSVFIVLLISNSIIFSSIDFGAIFSLMG